MLRWSRDTPSVRPPRRLVPDHRQIRHQHAILFTDAHVFSYGAPPAVTWCGPPERSPIHRSVVFCPGVRSA